MPNKKVTRSGIGCVIVMILLVVAIYPALDSSPQTYHATALKARGRNVWIAIVSANTERDLLGKPMLWPEDLEIELGKPFDSAEVYFSHLMSDGESGTFEYDPMKRVVPGLNPEMLTGPGLKKATGSDFSSKANAWHVISTSENSPVDMPFLVSRNVKASEIFYSTETELAALNNDWRNATNNVLSANKKIKPFGDTLAVWVNRGGNVYDARKRYLTRVRVVPIAQPEGEPELRVLPSIGGYR